MKSSKDWLVEWNELHCKYIKIEMEDAIEGVSDCGMFRTFQPRPEMVDYRNEKMADYCEEMMTKAKAVYYKTGDEFMDDNTFDKLENALKLLRPDSELLEKVGS